METLEEMRAQFQTLNRKLEQQTILNDRLLHEAMRKRVSAVTRIYIVSFVCCAYVLTFGLYAFHQLGLSDAFLAATAALILVCAGVSLYNGGNVLTGTLLEGSMLQIAERAARNKRLEKRWFRYGHLLLAPWGCWLGYELWSMGDKVLLCILAFSFVIGLLVGYNLYRKIVSAYNDLIRDIEDFQQA